MLCRLKSIRKGDIREQQAEFRQNRGWADQLFAIYAKRTTHDAALRS